MTRPEDVPGLRIGEVAARTGMTIAALRAWERRYQLLSPARTAGGQRLYSEADVSRVQFVQRLVAEGWSIPGAVARLRESRVATPDRREALPDDEGGPPAPALDPPVDERHTGLLAHLADVDSEAVLAGYEAARAMMRATDTGEVTHALVTLVQRLGGAVGPAATQDEEVLPVDLSLGEGPPMLPRVPPATVARMRLEAILPGLVEDGRQLVHRLRLAGTPTKQRA